MNAHLSRQLVSGSESAAHLSALEAAHQEVETCVTGLEAIMGAKLSDVGQFSSARLRLRQANVARTQAALDASRHLIRVHDPQPELLDLKQRELDQSQSVSRHVQSWDLHRIQRDWDGYCRATRRILLGVRELVALEKRFLCSCLRDRLRR